MAFCSEDEGRLCRWALALQEFDFEIKYRRGSSNGNADALSRVPAVEVEASEICSTTLITPELTTQDPRRTTEGHCTAASNPTPYVTEQYIQAKLEAVPIKTLLAATKAVTSA